MKIPLLLTLLLPFISVACSCVAPSPAIPYNLAAIAHPRLERNSLDRRWDAYAMRQIEEAKDAEIIFLGDSITDFWSKKGNNQVWNETFSDFKVANMGISSDGTQHLLYRLKMFRHKYPQSKPKCFFLMIGTNNIGYLKHTVPESIEGTMAVVKFLVKNYPESKIIVSTLTPTRSNEPNDGFSVERVNDYDQGVLDALKKDHLYTHVIHFNSRDIFLDKNGNQKPGIFKDKCHLTVEGYKLWGSIILPELKKQLK